MYSDYPIAYLRLSPWHTIVSLINSQYGTKYTAGQCILVSTDCLTDEVIEVTVAINEDEGIKRFLPPTVQHVIAVKRLHIGEFIGTFAPKYPSEYYHTTTDLVKELAITYDGIRFSERDFDTQLIASDVRHFELEAARYSLRWYGAFDIHFPEE